MSLELQLTEGVVTLPCEALVANLTFEEIGVIATFKAAFEAALHDPQMQEELSVQLEARLKDKRFLEVMRSLQERGIFDVVVEDKGKSVTLRFDLEKA